MAEMIILCKISFERSEKLCVVWMEIFRVNVYLNIILRSPRTTPIRNVLSAAPQLSISQKALGTPPEEGNVVPKHVGATIHN
jgi:hypothetical protein